MGVSEMFRQTLHNARTLGGHIEAGHQFLSKALKGPISYLR